MITASQDLVAVMLRQRWPTLIGLAVGIVSIADGLNVTSALALATIAMASVYLPIGFARGELRAPRIIGVEIAGVLGVVGLAVLALSLEEQAGAYVLAAAWLGHAAWDLAPIEPTLSCPEPGRSSARASTP